MRDIEFRAWDGNTLSYEVLQNTDGPQVTELNENIKNMFLERHSPQYKHLMQYTGLKDKNGKKIFEGDIVEFAAILDRTKIVRARVEYCGGSFVANGLMHNSKSLEVIGNIYEHPHLL